MSISGSIDERILIHSEHTAREIDQEVKRIIDEALERVREILHKRRGALVALAKELIEVESIDADELKRIVEENASGPLVVPGTTASPKRSGPDNHSSGADQSTSEGSL